MHTLQWLWTFLLALWMGAMPLFGCRQSPAEDRVVARVYGRPLLEQEVRTRFLRRLAEGPAAEPLHKPALWAAVLDDLLLEAEVRVAAREHHVAVLEDEVEGWLARHATSGGSALQLRQSAHAYLLLGKLVATLVAARVTVEEADLDAFAVRHPELLTDPVRVRLHFVRLPSATRPEAVQRAVQRGRAPADAAKDAVGRPVEAGDFGLVALASLPAEVQKRVERLPLHRLSEPVLEGEQQWLFWLSERRSASRAPSSVTHRRLERALREERQAEAEKAVLHELRTAARAEIVHGTMPSDV